MTAVKQSGVAKGGNAGFQGTYLFTPRYGVDVFARYAGGVGDLPAVSNVTVGGFQTGLGFTAAVLTRRPAVPPLELRSTRCPDRRSSPPALTAVLACVTACGSQSSTPVAPTVSAAPPMAPR